MIGFGLHKDSRHNIDELLIGQYLPATMERPDGHDTIV